MSYFQTTARTATFRPRRDNRWQRNQNTVAYTTTRAVLGPVSHTVLVALMIAVLGLIYLSQVTKSSSYGYALKDQSDQLTSLNAQRQELEIENARLQALKTVEESTVAKAMVTPVSVDTAAN